MRTAVDTNFLLSAINPSEALSSNAARALAVAAIAGPLSTSPVCYAEVARSFREKTSLDLALLQLDCRVSLLDEETAFLAGRYFEAYRTRGGEKTRILADFLIAADASIHADRLLTRDKRFFNARSGTLIAIAPEDI